MDPLGSCFFASLTRVTRLLLTPSVVSGSVSYTLASLRSLVRSGRSERSERMTRRQSDRGEVSTGHGSQESDTEAKKLESHGRSLFSRLNRSSLTPFPYASRSSHSSLVRSSRSPAARAYVKNEEMNRSRRRQASRGTEGRDERENVERIRILFPKEKRKRNANRRK